MLSFHDRHHLIQRFTLILVEVQDRSLVLFPIFGHFVIGLPARDQMVAVSVAERTDITRLISSSLRAGQDHVRYDGEKEYLESLWEIEQLCFYEI